jgi:hypothetical protein
MEKEFKYKSGEYAKILGITKEALRSRRRRGELENEYIIQNGITLCKEPTLIEVLLKKDEILLPKVSSILNANGSINSFPMEDMMPLLSLDEIKDVMGDDINPKSTSLRLKVI